MDDLRSLANVHDFASRIEQMPTDPKQEKCVRGFLGGVVEDCPMSVLSQIAKYVLGIRLAELRKAGETN